MRDEITYPSPNFNGCTVEVWERISNFTPHFANPIEWDTDSTLISKWIWIDIINAITYPSWDCKHKILTFVLRVVCVDHFVVASPIPSIPPVCVLSIKDGEGSNHRTVCRCRKPAPWGGSDVTDEADWREAASALGYTRSYYGAIQGIRWPGSSEIREFLLVCMITCVRWHINYPYSPLL